MTRLLVSLAVIASGCGRLGYGEAVEGGVGDAGSSGDAAPVSDAGPDAAAVTVTFGEGEGAAVNQVTADTEINSNQPTRDFGASDELRIDSNPIAVVLLRFNLTSIPATATVDAVLATIPADTLDTEFTVSVPAPVVAEWVSNPDSNFGFVLSSSTTTGSNTGLVSREGVTNRRPRLSVEYVP